MDTKPKRKHRAIKKKSNINLDYVKNDFTIQRIFDFVNPFAVPVFGGKGQEPEARLFTFLINLINSYVGYCNNFSYWDTKGEIDKKRIKKNEAFLKALRNEVKAILEEFVPNYDTSKQENVFLRLCRRSPETLVRQIEVMVKAMEPYVTKPYNISDIKTFYKSCFKKTFPKKIKIYDSSKAEIALSIVAGGAGCRYRTLVDIYYSIPIKKREEIADSI